MLPSYIPNKYLSPRDYGGMSKEEMIQELHQVNKARSCDQLLKSEMDQEIESLQKELKMLKESNTVSLRASQTEYTKQIRTLTTELYDLREHYQIAEEKYKEATCQNNTPKQNVPTTESIDYDQIKEEMKIITREKEYLADELNNKYKPMLEQKQIIIDDLNSRFNLLTEQYNEIESYFKGNQQELSETRLALQESREQNAILSTEIATLKAGSVGDLHRGNSLFAEVEDNRQTLVQKFALLKNKYSKAKKAVHEKGFEIQKLKQEIAQIQMCKQDENMFLKEKEDDYIHTLLKTNTELNSLISQLKRRPESPEIITISESDLSNLNWIHAVIEDARKREREAINNFLNQNLRLTEESSKLYAANIEIKQLRDELWKSTGKIKELELKQSNTSQENEVEDCNTFKEQDFLFKEKTISNKSIRFADDVKGGED